MSGLNCARCGKSFKRTGKRGRVPRYCSRTCRLNYQSHRKVKTCPLCGRDYLTNKHAQQCHDCRAKVKVERTCQQCSRTYSGSRGSKYCSEECQFKGTIENRCSECGAVAMQRRSTLFCSKACSDRYHKRRRRAMKLALFVEDVSLAVLLTRDRGICQLCNRPVNLKVIKPHPDSPSIDHVIPFARNGEHSYANTQLAHFHCNVVKGKGTAGILF